MNDIRIYLSIGIILAAGFLMGILFRKLKQSTVVAYLVSGVLIGPHGLGLIRSSGQIDVLSEVGVILLMFILGMSFPPRRLKNLGGRALLASVLQIAFTVAATAAWCSIKGMPLALGLFLGGLTAFSSTAIVIKVLTDMAFTDTLHGRLIVSALIVQDIAAVLFIAMTPNFMSGGHLSLLSIAAPLVKGLVFVTVFMLLNRTVIPRVQYWIASRGNKELFLIGTIVFCLAMAVLSKFIGLSLALGAFIAGLIVSESDFNYQILAGITPFRDAFLCIFFVTLGMLLDPMFVFRNPGQVILLFLGIVVLKFILASLAMAVTGYSPRTALLTGAGLAQIGEFSFIILKSGLDGGLVDPGLYNLFLSSSLISMVLTPYFLSGVPAVMHFVGRFKPLERFLYGRDDPGLSAFEAPPDTAGHVLVCGYGPIGRNIGRVLKQKGIPFVALDMNARTVATMKKLDIPIFFGDASSSEVLRKVHADKARLAVITTPDRMSGEQILKNIKSMNPDCFVLIRSHFSQESEDYYDFGADAVVQEEFEAGLRMLSTSLTELGLPEREVENEVRTIRIERDDFTRIRYFSSYNFSSGLSASRIVMNLKARTKKEVFTELVAAASNSPQVSDREEFLKRALEREEMSNTGLGNGIAIPHARAASIRDVVVAVGISRKGIDYDAPDGRPVRLFILFGVDASAPDLYLRTLSSVARVLDDADFVESLLECRDPDRLIRLIQDREKKTAPPAPKPNTSV